MQVMGDQRMEATVLRRAKWIVFIFSLFFVLIPSQGWAAKCSQADSDAADQLFEGAIKKLKAKSYEDGLALLKQAIGKLRRLIT